MAVMREWGANDLRGHDLVQEVRKSGVVCLKGCTIHPSTVVDMLERLGGAGEHWEPSSLHEKYPFVQINESEGTTKKKTALTSSQVWHTDGSFQKKPPNFTVLLCKEAPEEGACTEFIDMRQILLEVSSVLDIVILRRITALHSVSGKLRDSIIRRLGSERASQISFAATHPLVRSQPGNSDVKSLFYNPLSVTSIDSCYPQTAQGVVEVINSCLDNGDIYSHKWEAGDCLIWDNSIMLHRKQGVPIVGRRLLYRGLSLGVEVKE